MGNYLILKTIWEVILYNILEIYLPYVFFMKEKVIWHLFIRHIYQFNH